MTRLVIVGGGHAAAQLAASLAEKQFPGSIVLVSDESEIPYHRPPLSKTLIKDPEAPLPELRGAAFYEQAAIELRLGTRAQAIDRAGKQLRLSSAAGQEDLAYDHLVLATGARVRELPQAPLGTPGVHYLRTYAQARALRDALPAARRVVVLGGGFIGLEIAATARHLGKDVTVFESMPRLLARSVSPEISSFLLEAHRRAGVDIRLDSTVDGLDMAQGRAVGVLAGGSVVPADIVIAGIGATPEVDLAREAGLSCDNGIVVDATLATSDPAISAIGDCTSFPHPSWPRPLRLESVQNANDQARTLAARLCGDPQPYTAVPWFWSDQGEARLQITGLWRPGYESIVRPAARGNGFSVLHFEGDALRAIESVNSPVDQMTARKLMQAGLSPAKAVAADPAVPLKA
ncbi:FAD-dependent oxidoreductase [Pigmentiphaga sp.]|uniref:NAD(P)/FAD-dependent oxidoreductase n=1 Tax=Pigmentiphaga sp. TaxID=1977564 RepID=UPI00128B8208|nr:FAD-dependent oxidoreductase [Pigmentiphaga sp.]MPS25970.1 ferredoxin reductase [Alcaligenaceae bacterium SAGV5]MPS52967.1 ferredoxin reductase [Alcaligenaceae bacterium SAGV3]MPT59871.1 ferredoxin reductase [Alcaligenaceae bacterium]